MHSQNSSFTASSVFGTLHILLELAFQPVRSLVPRSSAASFLYFFRALCRADDNMKVPIHNRCVLNGSRRAIVYGVHDKRNGAGHLRPSRVPEGTGVQLPSVFHTLVRDHGLVLELSAF